MIMSKTQSGIFAEVAAAQRETAMRKFRELTGIDKVVFIFTGMIFGIIFIFLILGILLALAIPH
jgi:hypothetical protein